MNVAMMDLICTECGRRRSASECGRRLEARRSVADASFERDFRGDAQIEQIERSFGRNWKW